jgi:hypothetical protein
MRPGSFFLCLPTMIGATIGVCSGLPAAGVAAPCTYFVAATGSDGNDGTSIATPFATLEKAQSIMRRGSAGVVCLRAGTYHRPASLVITAADNGETWQYYPSDGANSAVLDGGNSVDLFSINGASNVTIDGLKMQHVFDSAVSSGGALSNNLTIENCDIGFNQHTSLAGGFNPMIGLGNVTNAHVLNNYVHDTASQGVALYAYAAGDTIDGAVVSGNVVVRAVQRMDDGGAIYINMRNTNVNGGHVTISNNYVKNYGAAGISSVRGIYLDDDSSNVTVIGNVIGPPDPGTTGPYLEAVVFNGGSGNRVTGNIIDLGNGKVAVNSIGPDGGGGTISYGGPTSPNSISGNIIIANYSGVPSIHSWDVNGHVYDQGPTITSKWLTISGNLYHNYGGGAKDSAGNRISDANPIFADPRISGSAYTIESGSPVFGSAMNFKPIVGGWGPSRFVIPPDDAALSNAR